MLESLFSRWLAFHLALGAQTIPPTKLETSTPPPLPSCTLGILENTCGLRQPNRGDPVVAAWFLAR